MLLDGENEVTSTSTTSETPTTPPEEEQQGSNTGEITPEEQDRTFTRDEVTTILKKRLERYGKGLFKKLGIESEEQLDEYINSRNLLQTENDDLKNKNLELSRTNSFLKNNINPERYEDIVAYFKGKGIEFSEDELLNQLTTHPEWLKQEVIQPQTQPQATLEVLAPGRGTKIEESEEDKMNRVFGFKK